MTNDRPVDDGIPDHQTPAAIPAASTDAHPIPAPVHAQSALDPHTCPTGVVKRRSPPNPPRTPEPKGRGFLDLPAASSLTVLLSAACLLGGTWGILAPTLGDPTLVDGRFAASGSIASYLAALFGCSWLLVRWQRGNPDAIGPALVGAAFLPGLCVTIDLIAPDRPLGAGLLAVGALVMGLLLWRGWRSSTDAGLTAPGREGLSVVMFLLLGWNVLWPVVMGASSAGEAKNLAIGHAWNGLQAVSLWLPGWIIGLVACGLLLFAALCGPNPWRDGNHPFLLRAGMRWVLALTMFLTSTLHQWVLAHCSGIDLVPSDLCAPVVLLVLTINEWFARRERLNTVRDGWTMGALGVLGFVLVVHGSDNPVPIDPSVPWLATFTMSTLLSPVMIMALTGLAGLALGWRRGSTALQWGAALPLLVVVLGWKSDPGFDGLNWASGLAALTLVLGVRAWARQQLRLTQIAVAILQGSLIGTAPVHAAITRAHLQPFLVLMTVHALSLLLTAVCLPKLLPARDLRLAAWALLVGVGGCFCDAGSAIYAPVSSGLGCTIILLAAAWRTREWTVTIPLMVPAAVLAVRWAPENKAWLAVVAAFLLLGAALGLGWRRIKIGQTTQLER